MNTPTPIIIPAQIEADIKIRARCLVAMARARGDYALDREDFVGELTTAVLDAMASGSDSFIALAKIGKKLGGRLKRQHRTVSIELHKKQPNVRDEADEAEDKLDIEEGGTRVAQDAGDEGSRLDRLHQAASQLQPHSDALLLARVIDGAQTLQERLTAFNGARRRAGRRPVGARRMNQILQEVARQALIDAGAAPGQRSVFGGEA